MFHFVFTHYNFYEFIGLRKFTVQPLTFKGLHELAFWKQGLVLLHQAEIKIGTAKETLGFVSIFIFSFYQ